MQGDEDIMAYRTGLWAGTRCPALSEPPDATHSRSLWGFASI